MEGVIHREREGQRESKRERERWAKQELASNKRIKVRTFRFFLRITKMQTGIPILRI